MLRGSGTLEDFVPSACECTRLGTRDHGPSPSTTCTNAIGHQACSCEPRSLAADATRTRGAPRANTMQAAPSLNDTAR